jgi:VWFA-related protein
MRRTALVFALVASTGLAAAAGSQAPGDVRSPIHIHAVATDRRGNPVTDLRPDEFEVWINVYQVPIQTVTVISPASARRRAFVLLLDDLATGPELALRVREAARRFVAKLAPGDEMAVVPLNGGATKSTDDRARLLRAIDAYSGLTAGMLPFDRLGEHVLNTFTSVSRQFSEVAGTKVFVGIGTGWVFDTPVPHPGIGRDVRQEWGQAMRALALANATVYVIDPGGVGTAPFATGGASGFASETGGYAFLNTNDYDAAADRILRETSNYYVLDVADPPIGRKADLRELDVRVKRDGVTVRARKWIPGVR